jgi:SSS family solute:Na+ symporter
MDLSLRATPAYLGQLLPVGFIGILLAAALAAEMSTDSGYLLTWATVIYNDLISPCIKKPLAPARRLLITRGLVLAIGVFLLFYGLWYEMPGNAWDYLAVTGNIYLASVFTLLVAALYWRRATSVGACAALVLGAIGPITFLVVNHIVPKTQQIAPEVAGASSFALAFAGMFFGSMLSRPPAETRIPSPEVTT